MFHQQKWPALIIYALPLSFWTYHMSASEKRQRGDTLFWDLPHFLAWSCIHGLCAFGRPGTSLHPSNKLSPTPHWWQFNVLAIANTCLRKKHPLGLPFGIVWINCSWHFGKWFGIKHPLAPLHLPWCSDCYWIREEVLQYSIRTVIIRQC